MDPNPRNFPILSYVMARFPSMKIAAGAGDRYDVEQPSPTSPASLSSREPNFELAERMPHLKDPKLLSEMRLAVADVAQTRAMLKQLGERPDHESVDSAKMTIAEVDANLSRQLDDIVLSPKKGEDEVADPGRKTLEREKQKCKALISLDEMHEAYEKLLTEAEDRLNRLYEAAVEGRNGGVQMETVGNQQAELEEKLNEEVVAILKQVEGNETVERVYLSGKQLRLLPEAFGKIKTLVLLDLSNNQLEVIPDSIAGLENLEELNLYSNLLENLPDSIGLLYKLKVLDVSRNKLSSLPDSICHCRSLVELKAGFNKLTYLPTNIGHELENLKTLIVPWNKIRHLPTSIGETKSLQHLDVHFNELHSIPSSIGKLSNLEILNFSNNFSDLSELPNTIGELINLKQLDLSNNQIHELPDTIGLLENLSVLKVDENPLLVPPKEIVNGGVEAIRAYMVKIRLDRLVEEDERSLSSSSPRSKASVLTRSTTWLNNVVSNVSDTVLGYIDGVEPSKDPCLNQQL